MGRAFLAAHSGAGRCALPMRRAMSRHGQRGQLAVVFVILMALVLLLAPMTMNLGEVAKIKTATANAADAGALAGASWVASGENEIAFIAMGMWNSIFLVQLIALLPFCWSACLFAAILMLILFYVNYITLYEEAAIPIMEAAWESARSSAFFTTIQNLPIDDTSGDVNEQLETWAEDFQEHKTLPPMPARLAWTRIGGDGQEQDNAIEVTVAFEDPQPELEMGNWPIIFACWSPTISYCDWPTIGWDLGDDSRGENNEGSTGTKSDGLYAGDDPFPGGGGGGGGSSWFGAAWGLVLGWVAAALPPFGSCDTCFGFPVPLAAPIAPDKIEHGSGHVRVTVKMERESGGQLRFWTMKYPAGGIQSESRVRYSGANVGIYPDPDADANIMEAL